jgi:hypothetical protein
VVNALIRVAVLSLLAFLVARTARQERELKVLQGLLPICMFCKRIRDEHQSWQKLETYISAHSEAAFSHGLCPECAQQHYAVLLENARTGSLGAALNDSPATPSRNSEVTEAPLQVN